MPDRRQSAASAPVERGGQHLRHMHRPACRRRRGSDAGRTSRRRRSGRPRAPRGPQAAATARPWPGRCRSSRHHSRRRPPCHSTTIRSIVRSSSGDQPQRALHRRHRAEGLLVAVAMQIGLPADRLQRQRQPPGLRLAQQELLEQQADAASRVGLLARDQRRKLVAQGEEAGRLQPDDALPARTCGISAAMVRSRLRLGAVRHAGGDIGPPAAERAVRRGRGVAVSTAYPPALSTLIAARSVCGSIQRPKVSAKSTTPSPGPAARAGALDAARSIRAVAVSPPAPSGLSDIPSPAPPCLRRSGRP